MRTDARRQSFRKSSAFFVPTILSVKLSEIKAFAAQRKAYEKNVLYGKNHGHSPDESYAHPPRKGKKGKN